MKPKISIVMTYFERYQQLKNTLKTFVLNGYDPDQVEVIVVDDASIHEPLDQAAIISLPFPIKVIRMPEKKDYSNPSVPYNKGFKEAQADIIIIQNSECMHVHNIVNYTLDNLTDDVYLSFSCYSINKTKTESMFLKDSWTDYDLLNLLTEDKNAINDGDDAWYNHSIIRPNGYHFCSAISKNRLEAMNGFDERYSQGIAFDDNEILVRIKRMGLKVDIIDEISVIHQWHYSGIPDPDYTYKFARNGLLYLLVTKNEKGYSYDMASSRYRVFLYTHKMFVPLYTLLLSIKKILNKYLRK